MRRTAVLFIAFCAAFAQDDPRARARDLERQAEKALDEGRRADALKLLRSSPPRPPSSSSAAAFAARRR